MGSRRLGRLWGHLCPRQISRARQAELTPRLFTPDHGLFWRYDSCWLFSRASVAGRATHTRDPRYGSQLVRSSEVFAGTAGSRQLLDDSDLNNAIDDAQKELNGLIESVWPTTSAPALWHIVTRHRGRLQLWDSVWMESAVPASGFGSSLEPSFCSSSAPASVASAVASVAASWTASAAVAGTGAPPLPTPARPQTSSETVHNILQHQNSETKLPDNQRSVGESRF